MIEILSELLVYLGGTFWTGRLVLLFIAPDKKPSLGALDGLALVALISIVIGTSVPLGRVFVYFRHELDLPVRDALRASLFDVRIGHSFLMVYFSVLMATIIVCIKRLVFIKRWLLVGLTMPLFLGITGTSHAAAKHGLPGLVLQTGHFSLMALWIGVVFVVGWGARDFKNWSSFLRWFSPLAQVLFVGVVVTGFFLMRQSIPISEYRNVWNLPYGQALLFKHLLLIPLLGYAFINGTLVKRRLQRREPFDPRQGLRFESIMIFGVFLATATLSNLEQPVAPFIETKVLLWSNGLVLALGISSVFLLVFTYQKRLPLVLGCLFSLLGVSLLYIGLVYPL